MIALSNESSVKKSNNLIAKNVIITNTSSNKYMISSTITNTSTENQNNINLKLSLFNSKKEEPLTFSFTIENILAGSNSTLFTISDSNLSDYVYYYIETEE